MDILQFTAGEDWQIVETCHKSDGTVLNLTDCTVEMRVYDDNFINFFVNPVITSPLTGVAIYTVTPTKQIDENVTGYRVVLFATRVTEADGTVSYQNKGVIFVASDPWAD